MIPIRLTLQGLYSYQEKQVIDFTRLTQAHIFGIFGSVGSGKSAILEAISYALYGRTDRLNLSGDNRYYNMMNLKSNELLIEFLFTAGRQDTEYLTMVKSRRNSRQFEDVKAIEHTAYRKVSNEWIPVEPDSLESIIGLSYENFKRTIIIPQGKFQEFLQLGNKERTQMMKELFSLDKFELYYKVISLEAKNNQKIQNLEGQLTQIGAISLPRIEECELELTVLKRVIEIKKQELALHQGKELEMVKLRDLIRRARETESSLNRLKDKEPAINDLEKAIREYEYCYISFKGLFESAHTIAQKIQWFEKNIGEDGQSLSQIVREISACKLNFDTARMEFEGREIHNRQAAELLKISRLIVLKGLGNKLIQNIRLSEKTLKETEEEINKIRLLQEDRKESLRRWKSQNPNMSVLSGAREWHAILKQLASARQETTAEISILHGEIEDIYKSCALLWQEECFSEIPRSRDLSKTWELLENKKNGVTLLKERIGNKTEHLSLQARLEEYATNLEDGKPCPLCGSPSHPMPLDSQNVKDTLLLMKQQGSDCEALIRNIEQNQKRITETESRIRSKMDVLSKLQQKLVDQDTRIGVHQSLFRWDAYKDESELNAAFFLAEETRLRISEGESHLEILNNQYEENNKLKEKNLGSIDEAKHQFTAIAAETDTLNEQIELLKESDYFSRSENDIRLAREDLMKKYREAEVNFNEINGRLTGLQKNHDTISGRLQANREALAVELKEQERVNARIEEQLAQSVFSSLVDVKNILARVPDVEKEKKKVSDFREAIAVATRQLSALTLETAERDYEEEAHRQLIILVKEVTEELTSKNQQQGRLESELTKMKADLMAYAEMKARMSDLTLRSEDLKTLKQMFKASGFVNYISTVYLQELCHAANVRFYKLTRQKLSLEVTDDNNFQVRDFLNGGKVRNVKTLSGGQTFQAALSLSLALADSIQKVTESSQNFFFLDEGFGSLDKESLAVVFETLKSLRKENRIVGIISHVEEMQQEIDNYLKIVMDEERGSIIQSESYQ